MLVVFLTFFGCLSQFNDEDTRHILINPNTGSIVNLEEGDLKIAYEGSFINCSEINNWIATAPFQFNADLKEFLLRSNPHFFIDSIMTDCVLKVPALTASSEKVDDLLTQGYKISVTFHYPKKVALLNAMEKFIADDANTSPAIDLIKEDFRIVGRVIKNQFTPISLDRLEIYQQLLVVATEKRSEKDSVSLGIIHSELMDMATLYKEHLSDNKPINPNTVKLRVNILTTGNNPAQLKRIRYSTFADFYFKRTERFKSFNSLNPPYEEVLEKYVNYVVWVSDPGDFKPISETFTFDDDEDSTIDLLILKK